MTTAKDIREDLSKKGVIATSNEQGTVILASGYPNSGEFAAFVYAEADKSFYEVPMKLDESDGILKPINPETKAFLKPGSDLGGYKYGEPKTDVEWDIEHKGSWFAPRSFLDKDFYNIDWKSRELTAIAQPLLDENAQKTAEVLDAKAIYGQRIVDRYTSISGTANGAAFVDSIEKLKLESPSTFDQMIADSNKILSVMGKDENAYSEAEKIALLREVTKAMAAGKSPFDARDIEHITSGHNSATQFYYFYENEFGNPEVSATQAAIPSQGTGINNSAGSGNDSEGILKMVQEMGPWGAVIIGILAMVAPNIIASIPGVKNLPFVETLAKDGGFMDKAGGWTIALGLLTMVVSGDTMAEKFENIKTQGMAAVNIPGLSNDNSRTV